MAAALEGAISSLQEFLQHCEQHGSGGSGCISPAMTWEDKLQAVRTAIACPQGTGTPREAALPHYQLSLAKRFMEDTGNHVAYLPLGLGMQAVVEEVVRRSLQQRPDKHVVLVVDRPAQALGTATRLRKALNTKVAVFCGGDFLYSFAQDFASARVLVFTAGLLLRLVKMGTYSLSRASLLVLMDAFAVIRNHPMNTLIREYYWKTESTAERPRLLGVLSPQLHSKPRPFDKTRQHVRKLQHSMHAALLLPGAGTGAAPAAPAGLGPATANGTTSNGSGDSSGSRAAESSAEAEAEQLMPPAQQPCCASLAEVEGGLQRHAVMLHGYVPWRAERALAGALQQHCLSLWDVLHEFNLNHFGRLLHFVSPGAAANEVPEGGAPQEGSSAPAPPPSPMAMHHHGAGSTPTAAAAGGGGGAGSSGGPDAAVQYAADPMQHDWSLVATMLRQSIWHTDMLPASGDHGRDPEALALMMHVLECVQALRACFELGVVDCLGGLLPSLRSLHALLTEGPPAIAPSRLRARISEVAAQSKLLAWAKALGHPDALGPSPTTAAAAAMPGDEEGGAPAATSRAALLLRLLRELAEEARQAQQAQQGVPMPVALAESNAEQAEQGTEGEEAQQAQQAQHEEGANEAAAEQAAGGEPEQPPSPPQQQQEEEQHEEQHQLANGSEHSHDPPLPRSTFVVVAATAEAAAALAETLRENASLQKAGLSVQLGPEGEGQLPVAAANGQHLDGQSNGQAEAGEAEAAVHSSAGAGAGARVVLLSREDLATQEAAQLLGTCNRVVWYSSDDVFHAASHDCDSAAIAACHALCFARSAAAAAGGDSGKGSSGGARGPALECHVLASLEQVAAYHEAQKADQTLKAALQLVQLGDVAFEDKLAALAPPGEAPAGSDSLEQEAANVLEIVCLGLCGESPSYMLTLAEPQPQPAAPPVDSGSGTGADVSGSKGEGAAEAEAETTEANAEADASAGAAGDDAKGSAAPAAAEAAAPGAAGSGGGGGSSPPPPPLRFRASVSLPQAHFPAQRFHPDPASMPARALRGRPQGCQADACNSAALRALYVLHEAGILARYWPSRLLLAHSLLPKGGALDGPSADLPYFLPGAVPLSQSPTYECPLCRVAATGHRAFGVHLRTPSHARLAQQAQQQGQELPDWLRVLQAQLQHRQRQLGAGQGVEGGGLAGNDDLEDGADLPTDRPDSPPEVEVYSSVPTQFHCPVCDVYCTSAWLLEAHRRGRKHQRRLAGLDSPTKAGAGRGQPLVTPYYCGLCGMYATSEDQLRMHCLGKRHSRNLALQRGGRGAGAGAGGRGGLPPAPLPPGRPSQMGGSPMSPDRLGHGFPGSHGGMHGRGQYGGPAVQQYGGTGMMPMPPHGAPAHMPYYGGHPAMAPGLAMHHSMQSMGGGWVAAPVPPHHMAYQHAPPPGQPPMGGRAMQQQQHQQQYAGGPGANPRADFTASSMGLAGPFAMAAGEPPRGGTMQPRPMPPGAYAAMGAGAGMAMQGMQGMPLPEGAGGRVYRCDLCGVVTPSKRHYDYHLQGAKHQRRQARQMGGAGGTSPGGSGAATPLSHPSSPAAVSTPTALQASPGAGRGAAHLSRQHGEAAAGGGAHGEGGQGAVGQEGALICAVCGIMATSQLNLEDHYKGRRHQKNVERLQRLQGMMPQQPLSPRAAAQLVRSSSAAALEKQLSGLGLSAGPDGTLLPAVVQRMPSGNVYDNFPCVRVGDVILPSSMDLRSYLEELQHLDAWDSGSQEPSLPAIAEHAAEQAAPPGAHDSDAGGSPHAAVRQQQQQQQQGREGAAAAAAPLGGGGGSGGGLQRASGGPALEDLSALAAEELGEEAEQGAQQEGGAQAQGAGSSRSGLPPTGGGGSMPRSPAASSKVSSVPSPRGGGSGGGNGSGRGGFAGRASPAGTPRSPAYWRGSAGGGEVPPPPPGMPPGPPMGYVAGPSLAQIPPGQASYGVVPMGPIPHMVPIMHPMQMQYHGMQYPPHSMAVPMQYHAHPMPMQPGLAAVQQPGGGWVPVQAAAYYPPDMQPPQEQPHSQHEQPGSGGRRGRGGS